MEFTYNMSGTKTWNAKTHEYDIDTKCEWSAKGNDISVTNHSNAAIDVDLHTSLLMNTALLRANLHMMQSQYQQQKTRLSMMRISQ